MSKLYIFDCDDFVPTEQGGLFSKGRREFALQSSSAALVKRVGQLVASQTAFAPELLPAQALRLLQHQGLVREVGASRRLAKLVRLRAQVFAHAPESVVLGLIAAWQMLRTCRAVFADRKAFTVLPARVAGAFARPWAMLTGPWPLAGLASLSAAWLLAHPSHLSATTEFTTLTIGGKLGFVLLLSAFVLFHETAHAAAAYHRLGFCGGIRFGLFYGLPYVRTGVPEANRLPRADRVAISASGSVLQVALSILALSAAGAVPAVKAAAELSIAIALVNWLPWFRFDGYWILSELAGGPLRVGWRWGSMRPADVLYSALTGIMLAGIVTMLVSA